MGPKKEAVKRENEKSPSIDDPINTSTWRCIVVMAVEKSAADFFIIKEFLQEASKEYRRNVKSLNYEAHVISMLNNFANGELPFEYAYLLNFSSVFQEALEYIKDNKRIPTPLLATVVKAFLFYMKEENLFRTQKKVANTIDPIQAMAQKPTRFGSFAESKLKANGPVGKNKKPEIGLKMRPPSIVKEDTKLLRRGECVKDEDCIDDAPVDGYFNLYVLLTGFYDPELPLELIKAEVPLHGVLCVDASLMYKKRSSFQLSRIIGHTVSSMATESPNYWDDFLENLWNPSLIPYFKDIVFQVYIPMQIPCDLSKIKEFFYKEISFLLYDISVLKRKHYEYLRHLKLINVEEPEEEEEDKTMREMYEEEVDEFPNESVTPAVVLHFIIKAVCNKNGQSTSVADVSWKVSSSSTDISFSVISSLPPQTTLPSKFVLTDRSLSNMDAWSQIVETKDHANYRKLYSKIINLDEDYDLDKKMDLYSQSKIQQTDKRIKDPFGCVENRLYGKNMAAALQPQQDIFTLRWKETEANETAQNCILPLMVDYCLYVLLITRVFCPFETHWDTTSVKTLKSSKNDSNFRLIENLGEEMRKPHFTVTEGSRSISKCIPYNVKNASRDFFCHVRYKTISPERVRASSAPEFHVTSKLSPVLSFVSDFVFPDGCSSDFKFNVYEKLRSFVGEEMFEGIKDFDFVEELNKEKLVSKESDAWLCCNCVDHGYFPFTDSIFVVFHYRKDSCSSLHESFNCFLRNEVGFRDFFDYILDDESVWFENQESNRKFTESPAKITPTDISRVYSDSDFWMTNSIKYQERLKMTSSAKSYLSKSHIENLKERKKSEKQNKSLILSKEMLESEMMVDEPEKRYDFIGFNVSSGMAVQYSGLATMYYTGDCNVKVQLIERLYGNQDLGIHINEGGHVLYVHSYVCPQPHVLSPYTFHAVLKSGIIIAFGRRYVETLEEIEEFVESKITIGKAKKTSSEVTTLVKKTKLIQKEVEDEEFIYDFKLSLPNGLKVEAVRNVITPCYIKQKYLGRTNESLEVKNEMSRLFLPSGNVIKMMKEGKVEILKPDASIITACLDDLVKKTPANEDQEKKEEEEEEETKVCEGELTFRKYEIVTRDGYLLKFEEGKLISSTRCLVFQNTDVNSNTVYFRRKDGTNFMLENDGSFTVQFKDGTKMSTSSATKENSSCRKEKLTENDEKEFTFVHTKTIIEHPNYATVIYNTEDKKWKILLPSEAMVTVETEGTYSVNMDSQTELKVERDAIYMSRDCPENNFWCKAKVDLTVFENSSKSKIYCEVKDPEETFVVENNSNCYVVNDIRTCTSHDTCEHLCKSDTKKLESDFLCSSRKFSSKRELCRSNKYYVARRDTTGFEILHKEDVKKALTGLKTGSVVFTQEIPGSENLRCFVLISPVPGKRNKNKWEVDTIIPNPNYVPRGIKAETSSTYGHPPTWMHPFPKRKKKLKIPEELTCRVFVECKRTKLTPPLGSLECLNFEIEDEAADEKIELDAANIHDYVRRVSDDDQAILRKMYILMAKKILAEKKNSAPNNSQKLEHYLALSRNQVELQEYHKQVIRYNMVPNYFESAKGMSWLLVNELVNNIKAVPPQEKASLNVSKTPSKSIISEEIEYNLEWESELSFSDLSYRSGISMETAPTILRRGGVCRCKVRAPKKSASAPICNIKDQKPPDSEENELTEYPSWTCHFHENQIDMLRMKDFKEKRKAYLMTLEDLMNLGLV